MSHPTNQIANDSGGNVEVTEDERHRLLAASRRRAILDVLDEQSSSGLGELAAAVAAREGVDDVERVAVSLHHTHLPLMADLGVLSYDPDHKRVTAHRDFSNL